ARRTNPLLRGSNSEHDEPWRLPSRCPLHQTERRTADLPLASGAGVDALAAREPRQLMASFHAKDGYLYIDFRWRGLRCRKATRLHDNANNRAQLRRTFVRSMETSPLAHSSTSDGSHGAARPDCCSARIECPAAVCRLCPPVAR